MNEKCQCGWKLPRAALAITVEKAKSLLGKDAGISRDDQVKGVAVALICPRCGNGHTFSDQLGN